MLPLQLWQSQALHCGNIFYKQDQRFILMIKYIVTASLFSFSFFYPLVAAETPMQEKVLTVKKYSPEHDSDVMKNFGISIDEDASLIGILQDRERTVGYVHYKIDNQKKGSIIGWYTNHSEYQSEKSVEELLTHAITELQQSGAETITVAPKIKNRFLVSVDNQTMLVCATNLYKKLGLKLETTEQEGWFQYAMKTILFWRK